MIKKNLLNKITDYKIEENVAHNIRQNGNSISRYETENIKIKTKKNKEGIDIIISKNTTDEFVHIPVVIDSTNYEETVYNDFYIGENSNVTIVAGCGIHNDCETKSTHNGIHTFHLEKNCTVKYIEKHYAEGEYNKNKYINTDTIIEMDSNSSFKMETTQISGIDFSKRNTEAKINNNSSLTINETLMSQNDEEIETLFKVNLDGKNSSANISSKSIAKDISKQKFYSTVIGNTKSFAHISCDAIIMDKATVNSTPELIANSSEAEMSHEAAIGKIAGDQIKKLMTLGLNEKEAENKILEGFIKS